LLGLCGDLPRLRQDLLILRFNLVLDNAEVSLRLVELLGGCGLLREQPLGALVGATRDLELRLEDRPLRRRRPLLRDGSFALGLEHLNLPRHLVHPRRDRFTLGAQLIALQAQVGGIDRADHGAAGQALPLLGGEGGDLPRCLGRDDNLRRLDVAVRVGRRLLLAPDRQHGSRCREARENPDG
jgi:hypothetical protein